MFVCNKCVLCVCAYSLYIYMLVRQSTYMLKMSTYDLNIDIRAVEHPYIGTHAHLCVQYKDSILYTRKGVWH